MSVQNVVLASSTKGVGRTLRLLLALLLVAVLVPTYRRVGFAFILVTILLVLGLIVAYTALHFVLSRRDARLNRWLGAGLAFALLVAVYILGSPGGIVFGRGEGQLAAVTFLAVSLIVAAIRADPGCEVMSIPGALFRRHTHLACLLFSPIDSIERKLRSRWPSIRVR